MAGLYLNEWLLKELTSYKISLAPILYHPFSPPHPASLRFFLPMYILFNRYTRRILVPSSGVGEFNDGRTEEVSLDSPH
jgi:hypothetical protein